MKNVKILMTIVALVALLAACGGNEAKGSEPENEEVMKTEEQTNENEMDNSVEEEEEEEAEQQEYGSREEPLQPGETVEMQYETRYEKFTLEMELIETIESGESQKMLEEMNPLNQEPDEGKEYILAKFRLKLLAAEEEPFRVSHIQFDVIDDSGSTTESFAPVFGIDPKFDGEVYVDGELEGWVPFKVDVEANDLVAKYGNAWFNLRGE